MTISEIAGKFGVTRRTAERMRNAIEEAFGPLKLVPNDDRQRHWRLESPDLRHLVQVTSEELASLESVASQLESTGSFNLAKTLRELGVKIRAAQQIRQTNELSDEYELLLRTEKLAMRPGPHIDFEPGLLRIVRRGIRGARKLAFDYHARHSGRVSQQLVDPYGVIYGNRSYMVGKAESDDLPHLWILMNMKNVQVTEHSFERDHEFDLHAYAERSFGAYQEEPFDVVLRFKPEVAKDAENYRFHPTQKVSTNKDGSLSVAFTAGGIVEMCWHLVTWETYVEVEEPKRLREHIAQICDVLAKHHSTRED